MSFYEPNYPSGALNLLPSKPRPIKKGKIHVGENYECNLSRRQTPWKHPFIGHVEVINGKSAVVKIIATHVEDDHLMCAYNHKTVVPLKRMKAVE